MAYIYQVSFDIKPDQMNELEIGASLERVLGFLRTLLPNEPGFVTTRALFSLDRSERTNIIFMSEWDTWGGLERHLQSKLVENRVLIEFEPHTTLKDLAIHFYEEIA
jgi:hypothetical protein